MTRQRGQIAMEFTLLIGVAMILLLGGLIIINAVTTNRTDEKTYKELDDLGKSIQDNLLLMTTLEDGFRENLEVPLTVNGRDYNITTGNISQSVGYMIIDFRGTEIYYPLPVIQGTLKKGNNLLQVINGTINSTYAG